MKSKALDFTPITYKELGDLVGKKATILVSSEWLEVIKGTIEAKKKCSKCDQFLSLDHFNNDKRRQFGKRSQCKSCYKEGADAKDVKSSLDKTKSRTYSEEVLPKIEYTLTKL